MLSKEHPFPGQAPDEKVLLFARRHWLSFLPFLGITIAMSLIPMITIILVYFTDSDIFTSFVLTLIIFGFSAYLLLVLAVFLVAWMDYYFDILILTDRRIIDIEQRGLFNREITELELLHIEDVRAELKGFWQSFFNFGEVYIQTAGTAPNFSFPFIPNPNVVARQIMSTYEKKLHTQPESQKTIDLAEGIGERIKSQISIKDRVFQEGEIKENQKVQFKNHPSTVVSDCVLIRFNIRRDRLEDILEILPSLKSPTINQLADKNYYSVESVVDKSILGNLVSNLKEKGAEDIIQEKVELL